MPQTTNQPDPDQVASDWITYASYDPDKAPEDVFVRGWVMYDLVEDDPSLAWLSVKAVVNRYTTAQLYEKSFSDAQQVAGNLAAGPLEYLLTRHGATFIDAVEGEARRDVRMRWLLGGVWRNGMTDDLWARVQQAADYSYWEASRPNDS